MAEQKKYFQWQNKVLKETIYPLREMKLRHVLEFDMEIYLWNVYKKYKDIEKLETVTELAGDIADYHKTREDIIAKAVKEYRDLTAYFNQPDVTALYKSVIDKPVTDENDITDYFDQTNMVELYKQEFPEDNTTDQATDDTVKPVAQEAVAKLPAVADDTTDDLTDDNKDNVKSNAMIDQMMAKINAMHKAFNTYFSAFNDAHKESVFISMRLEEWNKEQKDLERGIFLQTNRVMAMDPEHPNFPDETNLLNTMRNIVRPMLEEERQQLVALMAAHEKLSQRKLDYAKLVNEALKTEDKINTQLAPLQKEIARREALIKDIQDEVRRFKTPPELDSVKKYFSTTDMTEAIRNRFQQSNPTLLDKLIDIINDFHKRVMDVFDHIQDDKVRLVSIKAIIGDLQTFRQMLERSAGAIAQAELKTVALADAEMKARELEMMKENVLLVFKDELEKLKDYKFVLENSKQSKVEINRLIKARQAEIGLIQQPPPNPKKKAQLDQRPIASLRKDANDLQNQIEELDILQVTEETYVKTYVPGQIRLKDIISQKLDEFRATLVDKDQYELLKMIYDLFVEQPERYPPWLRYMIVHFSGMRYSSSHGSWADPRYLYMRLTNLSVTNIDALKKLQKDIEAQLTPEQALAALQAMHADKLPQDLEDKLPQDLKAKLPLPPWMWKEIISMTDLLVNQLDENDQESYKWERLTLDEQKEKSFPKWAKFREIINEWKAIYLTSWREEHERAHRLIVRRSVCNEVAEHIQHMRGHKGAAGLVGKPDWYRGEEKRYQALPDPKIHPDDAPFFIHPREFEDYRVGTSILWLKYKNEPAFAWEKVNDMTTSGGDRLVPYLGSANSAWVYQSGGITRMNPETRRHEYLFWIHEATVACPAETADGQVIFTFETALPYEDHRRAAIGMFKRDLGDLLDDFGEDNYNGTFLGYVPERIHTLQAGDRLYAVAQRFGVSPEEIIKVNGLSDPKALFIGQTLIIPGSPAQNVPEQSYIVQADDTLTATAQKFAANPKEVNQITEEIIKANGLIDPNSWFVGQTLIIPASLEQGLPQKSRTVQADDTLTIVAQIFKTTPEELIRANGLSNPTPWFIGQKLIIPGFPMYDLGEMLNWDHILLR